MSLLELRELLQYPTGDNASDTILNGVHFNLTALEQWHYTIYSNSTISNDSKCYLIFDNFKPHMLNNGTWINATTCYIPYWGIGRRGSASIAFAAAFGISIMFTLINLRKHGKLHLREDKRFRVVGRRWQWYWMLFAAGCGMVSTITGVDVDRYYLQQIPILLQSFFFVLMVPAALAMVWESVRHWGSWQERQIVDRDPFILPQDDKRARTEFWLPLVFYLFAWLTFFMTIPRSWTPLQKQNTPEQIENIARPASTGSREKAGAILAAMAWLTTCYSLYHSLKHYKPTSCFQNTLTAFFRTCPPKLYLNIFILGLRIGYGLVSAWLWGLTIFNDNVAISWPFGLGYGTILLIIVIFEVSGLVEENEDEQIIAQRRERGQRIDQELNIVHKPHWWKRNWAARYQTDEQRLKNMATEVDGERLAGRQVSEPMEMGDMNLRNRSRSRTHEHPFRDQSPSSRHRQSSVPPPPPYSVGADGNNGRYDGSRNAEWTGQDLAATENPQRLRSMLDV
ncbi:hypothetical protein B0J11DRAFT_574313 [Dendryphion nanum]|uniref:Uncharacterized protein n=1 Tax=Dendryphion nanum TaxID=256645 RepID=A0A9P9EI83_9PLEO|nr:hypothetical protein B0J11DRAFT_574313 [Dendryphion nanum]